MEFRVRGVDGATKLHVKLPGIKSGLISYGRKSGYMSYSGSEAGLGSQLNPENNNQGIRIL